MQNQKNPNQNPKNKKPNFLDDFSKKITDFYDSLPKDEKIAYGIIILGVILVIVSFLI